MIPPLIDTLSHIYFRFWLILIVTFDISSHQWGKRLNIWFQIWYFSKLFWNGIEFPNGVQFLLSVWQQLVWPWYFFPIFSVCLQYWVGFDVFGLLLLNWRLSTIPVHLHWLFCPWLLVGLHLHFSSLSPIVLFWFFNIGFGLPH